MVNLEPLSLKIIKNDDGSWFGPWLFSVDQLPASEVIEILRSKPGPSIWITDREKELNGQEIAVKCCTEHSITAVSHQNIRAIRSCNLARMNPDDRYRALAFIINGLFNWPFNEERILYIDNLELLVRDFNGEQISNISMIFRTARAQWIKVVVDGNTPDHFGFYKLRSEVQ